MDYSKNQASQIKTNGIRCAIRFLIKAQILLFYAGYVSIVLVAVFMVMGKIAVKRYVQ